MEVAKLCLEGRKLDRLIDLLRDGLPGSHVHSSDNTVVFASERFYFRVESNLLTVIILDTADEERYEVEIVTGGRAQGFLGITLGSERHRSREIIRYLEELCASNSWVLTMQPAPDSQQTRSSW